MTQLVTLVLSLATFASPEVASEQVLAVVNGRELTNRDLDAWFAIRGLRRPVSPAIREQAAKELVDRELIRQFLERRKTVADAESLAAAMRVAKTKLAGDAEDVEADLKSLGLDEQRVADDVALTLAWNHHARRTVSDAQTRKHWERHRRWLDGTRLRVSQIFRKYEPGESAQHAPKTTTAQTAIREKIAAGMTSFADAAKSSSQAPTAAAGGDVGVIAPRGDLPVAVANAAYELEVDEISEVVLSPYGAHLVTVTGIKPGDLSLEDARPTIFKELADRLWAETVAAERKAAKISEPFLERAVYDRLSTLYNEFVQVSEKPESPQYEAFYMKFKVTQGDLLQSIGSPDPGTTGRDMKNAVLTLGSAVEAYHRSDIDRDARELFRAAADEQMARLMHTYGK